jgi:O-antigen/teichoic acid export membrane protein
LGLTTVAIYGNYYYIIGAISTFVALIYSAVTASIGNSIAVESREKNYNDLKKMMFLNTWLVGWCCICFICLFQDFMTVWMGEKLLFEISTVLCLVLRFFVEQLRKVVLTYKDAAGMWWYDKWRPLVGCVVNLILNIILVKTIGVAGVALSTVASYALVELPWETHVLFKYYFNKSEIEYYKELLLSIITIIPSGIVTYFVCEILPIHGIFAIAVKLVICCILPNVLFIMLNLKNRFFIESKSFIAKMVYVLKRK